MLLYDISPSYEGGGSDENFVSFWTEFVNTNIKHFDSSFNSMIYLDKIGTYCTRKIISFGMYVQWNSMHEQDILTKFMSKVGKWYSNKWNSKLCYSNRYFSVSYISIIINLINCPFSTLYICNSTIAIQVV